MFEAMFIIIPAALLALAALLLLKKGSKFKNYDPLDKKESVLINAIVDRWVEHSHYKGNVKAIQVNFPILSYTLNGKQHVNADCCYRGYDKHLMNKYPVGENVKLLGIPSNFGKFKQEFDGYMFELYDERAIGQRDGVLTVICYAFGSMLLLASLSFLLEGVKMLMLKM